MAKKQKKGFYEKYIKVPQDVFLAAVALIVLSPVLLVVAILVRVKLGSPIILAERAGKRKALLYTSSAQWLISETRTENHCRMNNVSVNSVSSCAARLLMNSVSLNVVRLTALVVPGALPPPPCTMKTGAQT